MEGISVEEFCAYHRFSELFNLGAVDRIANLRMCEPIAYYTFAFLVFVPIGVAGFFLIRKLKARGKIWYRGTLAFAILAWVLGALMFLGVAHFDASRIFYFPSGRSIPPEDIQMLAEDYLKSKVGDVRYDDYFVLAADGHIKQENGYTVKYHFRPLAEVAPSNDTVTVHIRGGAVQYANMVPNCVQDATLCDFNVTGEQALEAARSNGFDAQDLRLSWSPFVPSSSLPLAIRITSCTANEAMYIDYRDGTVIAYVPEVICGGVP